MQRTRTTEKKLKRAIALAVAAGACRAAARKDPRALAGLYRCADKYGDEAATLLEDICRET